MLTDNLDVEDAQIIHGAIVNYRSAIQKNYGRQDKLGGIRNEDIEKFVQHVQPLMIELYTNLKSSLSDVQLNTLEEFLLNFSEIGTNTRTPNLQPNVLLIKVFYNDASDWLRYTRTDSAVPNPPIENQLDVLSARKLNALSRAGVDKFEDLDEYEKARIKNGYATFSSSEFPGCFDYSIAWFDKVLDTIPNELVSGLREFYREIIRPTTDNIDEIKTAVKRGNFSFTYENNHNSDKPYG